MRLGVSALQVRTDKHIAPCHALASCVPLSHDKRTVPLSHPPVTIPLSQASIEEPGPSTAPSSAEGPGASAIPALPDNASSCSGTPSRMHSSSDMRASPVPSAAARAVSANTASSRYKEKNPPRAITRLRQRAPIARRGRLCGSFRRNGRQGLLVLRCRLCCRRRMHLHFDGDVGQGGRGVGEGRLPWQCRGQ